MRSTFRALIALCSVLTACVAEDEAPELGASEATECGADTLQHLIGQPSGAHDFAGSSRPLRILPPGSAMTMDHRIDRLNVDLDDQGRIMRIWCG